MPGVTVRSSLGAGGKGARRRRSPPGPRAAPAPAAAAPAAEEVPSLPPVRSSRGSMPLDAEVPLSLLTMPEEAETDAISATEAAVAAAASSGANAVSVEAAVAKHVRTSDDAVEFYAQFGQDSPVTFFFCVRADTGLLFRPYDLLVVPRERVGRDYYTISATGVMHMRHGVRAGAYLASPARW